MAVMRIERLRPAEATRVSLRFDSLFTRAALQEHAREYPDLCWVSEYLEYVVGGCWKGREDAGEILELSGPARGLRGIWPVSAGDTRWPDRRAALVTALLDACKARGHQIVLLNEREADRNLPVYTALGFSMVEDIVYYRKPNVSAPAPGRRLVLRPCGLDDLEPLMALERRAFPWLWWYGLDEWFMISMLADVETFLAYSDGRLVGYETHTVRGINGHLDRIGIDPAVQGQGLGEELLLHAIKRIGELGGRSVGLSTQRLNRRARHLYEKHGFATTGHSLRFYGRLLEESARARLEGPP